MPVVRTLFRKLRRILMLLIVALVAASATAYLGIAAYLYSQQDAIIFRGQTRTIYSTATPANLHPLTLTTPDGETLHGILLPSTGHPENSPLVIAFGGTGQDAGTFGLFLRNAVFPGKNVTIAVFNYRGFASQVMPASTGTPSQQTLYADALLEYDALVKTLHPSHIHLIGYSLGTAMAAYTAAERPMAQQHPTTGLTLIAPFTSIRALATERYPWLPIGWLLNSPFPTAEYIKDVDVPTHLFYPPQDRLIPPSHAKTLAATLAETGHLAELAAIPGTGHVSILENSFLIQKLRRAILP